MSTTSVALALVQPIVPPEVWSGITLGERLLNLLFQRHADVYFRPLLQAPNLAALQWRILKLGLRFTAERRAVHVISLLTHPEMVSDRDCEEVYAHVQRKLDQSWFSEQTRERIDYVMFTMMRLASAALRAAPPSTAHATLADVFNLLRILGNVDLYVGTVLLALMEPSLIKNPLVLNDLAARASTAVDAYVAVSAKLGIEVA